MALAPGGFSVGQAGVSSPGGAYSYVQGCSYPQFFAGTFFIDTGYNDPATWSDSVEAAELYGARVYAASGTISPNPGASVATGTWNIVATPVWGVDFFTSPAPNANRQRILIRCDAYLVNPVSKNAGSYQRIDSVNWSLYRL